MAKKLSPHNLCVREEIARMKGRSGKAVKNALAIASKRCASGQAGKSISMSTMFEEHVPKKKRGAKGSCYESHMRQYTAEAKEKHGGYLTKPQKKAVEKKAAKICGKVGKRSSKKDCCPCD